MYVYGEEVSSSQILGVQLHSNTFAEEMRSTKI